jgi:Cysteine rich repeat
MHCKISEASNMHLKTIGTAFALALLPMTAFAQSAAPQTPTREQARAACAADVQKFCANIERAKGAMRSCLESHQTQLSDGCKAARAERAAARAKDKS